MPSPLRTDNTPNVPQTCLKWFIFRLHYGRRAEPAVEPAGGSNKVVFGEEEGGVQVHELTLANGMQVCDGVLRSDALAFRNILSLFPHALLGNCIACGIF